jgi:hypothetical protein
VYGDAHLFAQIVAHPFARKQLGNAIDGRGHPNERKR